MADLMLNNFLPPGFQFEPTDEELLTYFLYRKVFNIPYNPNIIPELDFHSTDPWNLNGKALCGKSGYYFFSRLIEGRKTRKAHWEEHQQQQQMMKDETVISRNGQKVGKKKYLVFFLDDKSENTSIQTCWFMEEYHLSFARFSKKPINQPQDVSEWVMCRVHDAKTEPQQLLNILQANDENEVELSFMDEVFLSMEDDDQDEITFPN